MWLKEGDRNTQYFHKKAVWRARKNKIKSLKKEDGSYTEDVHEMQNMTNSFFSQLYTKDLEVMPEQSLHLFDRVIDDGMNDSLCKPFTDEEVSNALFQIGPLKAPGPDGFPARFFQRNWDELRYEIIRAVKQFFEDAIMPPGVNDTSIVLVPKKHNSDDVVSKCLVNRLRPLLEQIISPNQSAFIPGRLIMDNDLIAFECIHSIQQNRTGRNNFCAYKLDLSKAYDRVDWDYLKGVLLKLGFHSTWVQWVMACVTTVRYSINFNGVLLDSFQPTRDLRQGDPLSLYLFLFVAECLSVLLNKGSETGEIVPLKVTRRAPAISHLMFADDSLLFFKVDEQHAHSVKKILEVFCNSTG